MSSNRLSITSSMLATGSYSDLTITCRGRIFRAHRAIVCLQSKVLQVLIDREFGDVSEGKIELEDDQPEIVEYMLEYMYNSDYCDHRPPHALPLEHPSLQISIPHTPATPSPLSRPQPPSPSTNLTLYPANPIVTNALVYLIAIKYAIDPLKTLAQKKYNEVIPNGWISYPFMESLRLLYMKDRDGDREEILKGVSVNAVGERGRTEGVLKALLVNGQKKNIRGRGGVVDEVEGERGFWCRECGKGYC